MFLYFDVRTTVRTSTPTQDIPAPSRTRVRRWRARTWAPGTGKTLLSLVTPRKTLPGTVLTSTPTQDIPRPSRTRVRRRRARNEMDTEKGGTLTLPYSMAYGNTKKTLPSRPRADAGRQIVNSAPPKEGILRQWLTRTTALRRCRR